MPRVDPADLIAAALSEPTRVVRARIHDARARARLRNGGPPNARLPGSTVVDACALTSDGADQLREVAASEVMSARAIHRVLRVARTIADLRDAAAVDAGDVAAALSLREDVLVRRLAA